MRWSPRGEPTALGHLGGCWSYGWGISPSGEVVGLSGTAGRGHAFLWSEREGMLDLGTLPGDVSSSALAINAHGQIVGRSTSADGVSRPVLWTVRR